MSDALCTVEFAATQLKLHPKTILRFIREGRLQATRVGKAFRILRADLDAFAGIPPRSEPQRASVTAIIDMHGVDDELARKWARQVPSALKSRPPGGSPMRADVIHDADNAHLKIIVIGPPAETVSFLSLVQVWLEQHSP